MKSDYPLPVQDFTEKIIETIKDAFGEDIGEQEFEECCLEACFQKWIKGEDMSELIEEDQLQKLFNEAILSTAFNSLKKKGIVDSMQDENGKDFLFLTPLGKIVKENLQNK